MSQFHVQQTAPEDQRPAHEVFKTSVKPDDSFKARFSSSGRFTSEQLLSGADAPHETPAAAVQPDDDEPEFDPNDTRSLYEKLKEQRDAKQEEWEEKHKFKNQMDHWRLDDDDAAFEDERVQRLRQQQADAQRQREEGSEFYRLARAAQEREIQQPKPKADATPWESKPGPAAKRKRPALPAFSTIKVVKPAKASDSSAAAAGAPAAAPDAAAVSGASQPQSDEDAPPVEGLLPGMDAYDAESDS